jgi:hypothetical protein
MFGTLKPSALLIGLVAVAALAFLARTHGSAPVVKITVVVLLVELLRNFEQLRRARRGTDIGDSRELARFGKGTPTEVRNFV